MHSFYIEAPVGGAAALPPEEARHALKVLRLRPGDAVCAMDGAGRRWRGEVGEISGNNVSVNLLEPLPDNEAPARVTVYAGLPKADKLDFVAQKLTEMGAAALVPVRMARCVTKLDGREGAKRRERLERIAREAAKQCGRGMPLSVAAPTDWPTALRAMAGHGLLLVSWEEETGGARLKDAFALNPEARDIGIVIGPEGGMTPEEVEAMRAAGGRCVTLGPRILRAETAAVVSAALALQLWGDI